MRLKTSKPGIRCKHWRKCLFPNPAEIYTTL
nr:MAG TPA: hypothetical protein [Caudoviricetes sp.]DAQ82160.1 MAG TPA: hypothetical protein [Caudoviricetes sp.]